MSFLVFSVLLEFAGSCFAGVGWFSLLSLSSFCVAWVSRVSLLCLLSSFLVLALLALLEFVAKASGRKLPLISRALFTSVYSFTLFSSLSSFTLTYVFAGFCHLRFQFGEFRLHWHFAFCWSFSGNCLCLLYSLVRFLFSRLQSQFTM